MQTFVIIVVVELVTASVEIVVAKIVLVDSAELNVLVNSELTERGEMVKCVEINAGGGVLMIVIAIDELLLNSDSIL